MASKTMIKNMFTLLSTSDNESDVDVKCDNIDHSVSDWETDEFKIKDDKEHLERKKDSVILPFKGVECVPLNSVKEENFPKLGASLPIPSKESIKSRKGGKKNTITFTVDRSYIAQNRHERSHLHRPNHCGSHDDPRMAAFSKMEDKEAVAKSLSCTRACKNVLQKQESGEYGVCLRHFCTFAHSLEELNDPMCGFDATCRFRHGRPRRDGTVDSNGKCMFLHSDETREDWLKRTGRKLPALPATSEKTRKPTPRDEDKVKALGSGYSAKTNLSTPATKITLSTPSAPRKMVWGKPVQAVTSTPVQAVTSTPKKLKFMGSDESPSDYDRRYRKRSYRSRRKRSRRRSVSPSSKTQVIRVPTEELAKIAIQAAFEHGVYNIQVLVE